MYFGANGGAANGRDRRIRIGERPTLYALAAKLGMVLVLFFCCCVVAAWVLLGSWTLSLAWILQVLINSLFLGDRTGSNWAGRLGRAKKRELIDKSKQTLNAM